MATVLDVGLLQSFDVIFPALLVFALVFALLQKTKVLGGSVGVNSIIAIVMAFMVLLSQAAIDIIKFMMPWFTIAIIFIVLLILLFQTFGATEKDIFAIVKGEKAITWGILGVALVIMIAAFASVLGQQFTEQGFSSSGTTVNATGGVATSDFQKNITATLFNPKVLAMVILFMIAIFAVLLLTG